MTMLKSRSSLAMMAALALAGHAQMVAPEPAQRLGYAMPNGWAPSRGSRPTKANKASKTAKNRAKAKAAAKSRREQRR